MNDMKNRILFSSQDGLLIAAATNISQIENVCWRVMYTYYVWFFTIHFLERGYTHSVKSFKSVSEEVMYILFYSDSLDMTGKPRSPVPVDVAR